MKERAQRKQQQKALANYNPSPYSKALNKYLRTTAKSVDSLLKSIAQRSPLAPTFPAYHSLRAASRLFLLSELEALLTAYALEITGWDIDCRSMERGVSDMRELFGTEGSQDLRGGLLMMVASFWSKTTLNESCEWLLNEARKMCASFEQTIEEWMQEHPKLAIVTPWQINCLYCSLHQRKNPNYNFLVDQILTLSHAYTSDNQLPPRKRSMTLSDSEKSPLPGSAPRRLTKAAVQFTPPELGTIFTSKEEQLGENADARLSSFVIFSQLKPVEGDINGFLQASSRMQLCLPSLFQSGVCEDFDFIEVGLGEGESELVVLDRPFPSVFLARRGVSQGGDINEVS